MSKYSLKWIFLKIGHPQKNQIWKKSLFYQIKIGYVVQFYKVKDEQFKSYSIYISIMEQKQDDLVQGQPLGPNELPEISELIIKAKASSLEKGLSEDEFALIKATVEQAKARGQKLTIRFRLEETEEELIKMYGEGDRTVAMKHLADKFKSFLPGSQVGGIFGTKQEDLEDLEAK